MKKSIFLLSAILATAALSAQNKVNITLKNGDIDTYNTADLNTIDIDGDKVTVNPAEGNAAVYDGTVGNISFIKNLSGHVTLRNSGGWLETAYVEWEPMTGATNYYVYVKADGDTQYTQLDYQLVRNYGTYGRADVPGLVAGNYTLKVVPVVSGTPMEDAASETASLTVKAHDRGGFAHFNYDSGIGAYNNDGTLKTGAKVFYVTANNAKTIKTTVTTNSNGKTEEFTGLQTILDAYMKGYDSTPICFRVVGCLHASDIDHFSSSAEGLQIKNNKSGPMNITIEGIGNDATIHGFGFLLRNAESVELRNLAIMWFMDDAVSIDTDNLHCWIHNLDIFYGQKGSDSDQAKGDGSIDIKGNSQYITVSANRFWDSGKCSLCGMTSETGPNWITYHHNWFDHSDSRHPRIRTMSVHVYNNYFDGNAKYGVGSTMGSDVFVEANYFRSCKYPMLTSLQGSDMDSGKGTFSSEAGGSIKSFGNVMAGTYTYRPYSASNTVEYDAYEASARDEQVPSNVTSKSGANTYSNWDTDPTLMYTYTPDAAEDIPDIVTGNYGAGRINHGDFKWVFNNSIQDTNYDVISSLSSTISAYDSYLVGFYEGDTTIGNGGVGFTNPGGDGDSTDSSTTTPSVNTGDAFIAGSDGGYMRFDDATAAQALIDNGTITFNNGSLNASFTNTEYTDITGALQVNKEGGTVTFKCPSVAVFKVQYLRTGSYKGTVEVSSDGSEFKEVAEISGTKGVKEDDYSELVKSDSETYVRITNTSSGSLNILGLQIYLAE